MLGALSGLLGVNAGGGMTGGSAGPSAAGGSSTEYSGGNVGLTIAPSGVNIGSILQPFNGNPENGGYGLSMASRLGYATGNVTMAPMPAKAEEGGLNPLLIGGIALAGVMAVLLLRR